MLGWNSSEENAGEHGCLQKLRYKGAAAEKYHDKGSDKKLQWA